VTFDPRKSKHSSDSFWQREDVKKDKSIEDKKVNNLGKRNKLSPST